MLPLPPPWTMHAACGPDTAQTMTADSHDATALAAARLLCRHCTVLDECRLWVLQLPASCHVDGVVGGLTERERDRLRRKRAAA